MSLTTEDLHEICLAMRFVVNEERKAMANDVREVSAQIRNIWVEDAQVYAAIRMIGDYLENLALNIERREDKGISEYGNDN